MASLFVMACAADSRAEPDQSYVFNFSDEIWKRPANFYRLTEYADKDICVSVLNKLNEPYSSEPVPQNSYFGLFTNNSATLPWQKRTPHSYHPIYFMEIDVDGDGVKEWVYKSYSSLSRRYIAFIRITPNSVHTSVLADSELKTDLMRGTTITFADRAYSEKQYRSTFASPETSFMRVGGRLIALAGEDDPDRFRNFPYTVFAYEYKVNVDLPVCKFTSVKKIKYYK